MNFKLECAWFMRCIDSRWLWTRLWMMLFWCRRKNNLTIVVITDECLAGCSVDGCSVDEFWVWWYRSDLSLTVFVIDDGLWIFRWFFYTWVSLCDILLLAVGLFCKLWDCSKIRVINIFVDVCFIWFWVLNIFWRIIVFALHFCNHSIYIIFHSFLVLLLLWMQN